MNIRTLGEAPTVQHYLDTLREVEIDRQFVTISVKKLRLTTDGMLQTGEQTYKILPQGHKDLARLAGIPASYYDEIDAELRAVNFNTRLPHRFGAEETVVIISNDKEVYRVQRPVFGQLEISRAIEAIIEAMPQGTVSNGIRVVEYERDRRVEVALVTHALEAEPRKGDIVCGGVHLTIEENGAVQIGPESFRLACLNGAMARVCSGGHHRLRRGQGKDSDRRFMRTLQEFARTVWSDWEHVKRGLEELAHKPLDGADLARIIENLRQAPFFISARTAARVATQLRRMGDDLTFFDLHNALTHVGTHDADVLPQYRHRLRLGAGHLARGRVGVCHACRRLMIGGATSVN